MTRAQCLRMLPLLLCAAVVFGCLPGCSRKPAETPAPPAVERPEPATPEPEPPVEHTAPEPYRPLAMGAKRLDNGEVTIGGFSVRVTPIAGEGVWRARRVRVVRSHQEVFNAVYEADAAAYFLDLNSDGLQECIISEYSMGAHCCFEYTGLCFDGSTGRVRRVLTWEARDVDLFYNGKLGPARPGRFRSILTYDARFRCFGNLAFVYSPWPRKVFSYANGVYSPATKSSPSLLRSERRRAYRELAAASMGKGMRYDGGGDYTSKALALEAWMYGYLLGEESSTLRQLERVAPPEATAWLARRRSEAVQLMRNEPF